MVQAALIAMLGIALAGCAAPAPLPFQSSQEDASAPVGWIEYCHRAGANEPHICRGYRKHLSRERVAPKSGTQEGGPGRP